MNDIFDQAIQKFESKNFIEAYSLFQDAALKNSDALVNLAIMHMQGRGCQQSYALAQNYFEEAAKEGNLRALYTLGVFYEKGMNGCIDIENALINYKKAADEGHIEAQLKAGLLMKEKGEIKEAMRYLITAAHNENAQAQSIITYVSNSSDLHTNNEIFHALTYEQQRQLIENLLQKTIMPTLSSDGGGIELVNFIAGNKTQIWLKYQGACSGCQLSSTSTADMLLDHFETMIDKNVVLYLM